MSEKGDSSDEVQIEMVYALPSEQQLIMLGVQAGTCARDAVVHALKQRQLVLDEMDASQLPQSIPIGVYGQLVEDSYILQPGDRLELYRPLTQDPKERRRQQAKQSQSRKRS